MKIAVPVSGENLEIFTRTGRAPYFAIFEFDGNEFKLIDLRENPHAKEHEHEHGHHHEGHNEDEINHHHSHVKAANLGECKYIVCRALGPNMKEAVIREGITPVMVKKSDGENALEVLEKIKGKLQ